MNVARSVQNLNIAPNGSQVVFTARGEVLTVSADKGEAHNWTNTPGAAERNAAWSPDGQWLAYEKNQSNRLKGVFLYSLATGKSFQVTNRLYNAESPAFDAGGKYLYFLQSQNAAMRRAFGMASFTFRTLITKTLNVAVLSKDGVSPLAPNAQQNPATSPATSIDPEGIGRCILTLPMPPRDYVGLRAGKPGVVFVQEATSLDLFDLQRFHPSIPMRHFPWATLSITSPPPGQEFRRQQQRRRRKRENIRATTGSAPRSSRSLSK